ncbi:MAG: hypothetical protein CYPHOPRED_003887 [Cyphobasidiales sp. Tagirdzhanova-0007]|nr:MAG: hypothetical protein CYPHOPRED_003887 [Cyphobasidiales sp. Tagirdzhanova-0007]
MLRIKDPKVSLKFYQEVMVPADAIHSSLETILSGKEKGLRATHALPFFGHLGYRISIILNPKMADFDLLRIEHMLRNPVEIAQPICEWLNEYWVGPLIMTARNDQEVVRIHYPMERMGFIDELLCFHHARSLQFRLSESLIEGFEPLILRLSPHWEKDLAEIPIGHNSSMSAIRSPAWLQSTPRGTLLVSGLTVALSLALSASRANQNRTTPGLGAVFGASGDSTTAFPWLVVVPGTVVWTPWTLATAAFCEASLIEFVFSLATLVLSGRYLERVWGQAAFLYFVFAVVVASNVIAVAVNVLEHFVLRDSGVLLFGQSYHGMMALQTGFLVAFTQLIPEHQVQLFGGLAKLRVKQLPMLYVTFSNVMVLLGYQSPFILIQFGWLVSWFYLRFIKQNEGMDFRGDRSETFAFSGWFPPFIQPYVAQISHIVFDLAVKLHLTRPWGPSNDMESGHVNTRAEAERRRALALKALDQRLAAKPVPLQHRGASSNQPASSSTAGATSTNATSSPSMTISGSPGGTNKGSDDVVFDSTDEASKTPLPKEKN